MLLDTAEPPIIIFVNQKKGVEVISNIVEKWGVTKNINFKMIFILTKIKKIVEMCYVSWWQDSGTKRSSS